MKERAGVSGMVGDRPHDMIVAGWRVAAEEVVVCQKVASELAIAPLVIVLQRIPESDERKNIKSFWRFKMEAENEVDVVIGELRVRRMHQASE